MPRASKAAPKAAPKAAGKTAPKAAKAAKTAPGGSATATRAVRKAAGAAAPKAAAKPAKARTVSPATASAANRARRPAPVDEFLATQQAALLADRESYMERADLLKAEAQQLAEEMEPGDTQFDEESGEGDSLAVERERDLALSAQARVAVDEIDHALARIDAGTYGICERCGSAIPKARLRALPHAALCVACKSGGLSRR